MARFFILLLVVLLPLRGWTAERMVVQMQVGTHAAAQVADSAMPDDCAMHLQVAQAGSGPEATDAAHVPDHKSCQSCQLCMPLAGLHTGTRMALATIPQALPRMRSCCFASADPARGVKPPIS